MRFTRFALRAATLLAVALGAYAQSNTAAVAPEQAKAVEVQAFKLAPGSIPAAHVRLEAPPHAAIEAVKQSNVTARFKALQIGIGQEVSGAVASHRALPWMPAPGGTAAHWQVTSTNAKALRVALDVEHMPSGAEIRFAGNAGMGIVHGPVTADDILNLGSPYWSPVLEGDTAIVEVFVPVGASRASLAIGLVSHLFGDPADPMLEKSLKAAQTCQVDFICRAANDARLAETGRAVARMIFTTSGGGSSLCTGTLLNPSDGSLAPYFYSAHHCISTQSTASTLTTHWFYERSGCATGTTNQGVQVAGGATLLQASQTGDWSFMRLNRPPPAGAVFAGWDASGMSFPVAVTGIHHPAGDVKKVSIGTAARFENISGTPGSYIRVNWTGTATGFTEPGSSGSGIFTGNSGAGYSFRGGLSTGSITTCSASPAELYDWYSRFDQVYPSIAQYLNPGSEGPRGPNVLENPGFENGRTQWTEVSNSGLFIINNHPESARTGTWLAHLGGGNNLVETLFQEFTVPSSQARLQFWYRIDSAETSQGTFDTMQVELADTSSTSTVTIDEFSNLMAPSGWVLSPAYDISAYAGRRMRLQFKSATDSSLQTSFRIDDVSVTGTTSAASANYTALWWNAPANSESGWGMNFVQQGDIAFATLFTYDFSGAPMWLFMSRGDRQGAADSFSGPLYRATGPAFYTSPFPSIGAGNLTQVGTMTVSFSGANSGTLSYSVNGVSVTKSITKQVFGAAAATCQGTSASRASATNYQDLWWNYPANSESGWGLNITHQGNILFGTLFTYDSNNRDLWLVMSGGERQPDGSYFGPLYQTTGPAFNAQPWGTFDLLQVGTMRLRFSNGETGTLEYTAYGITVTKTITRQVFTTPPNVPLCTG
jgi:lysyl endopeptidase